MARGAKVIVALAAIHDHLVGHELLVAFVALALLGRNGLEAVAGGALRQRRAARGVDAAAHLRALRCLLLRVAAIAQVPVAVAAVHDHLRLLDLLAALVACALGLGGPQLQSVVSRAPRDGVTLGAHVPVALAAVHDHLTLLEGHLAAGAVARDGGGGPQRVARRAGVDRGAGAAKVEVALAAVHHHLTALDVPAAPIARTSTSLDILQLVALAALGPRVPAVDGL
mmetsp:Transcript_47433/g.122570  ORF Transcript_47433/g.122570 Transcript_47433/m.122570 type:complete len:226 (-) Transcript_47433:182-859(-)